MQQNVNETLSEIADSLVGIGIYQDTTEALLAIATDFIDKKRHVSQISLHFLTQRR